MDSLARLVILKFVQTGQVDMRNPFWLQPACLFPLALIFSLLFAPAHASVDPAYPQALLKVKEATEAVLGRTGTEGCLQGKLMNAMVELSNSCDASGRKDSICNFADKFVMSSVPPLAGLDDAAQQFLKLTSSP